MALANGHGHIEVDSFYLRQICQSFLWMKVQDESAGEWAVLLPGMPEAFIDATDPTDMYPAHLWVSLSAYMDSLAQGHEGNPRMPGGRVACAQELASRQLYFFSGYKLGQICHIVQLAISQKHLLGYLEGCLVPYSMSQSMVKEKRAAQQKPIATRGSRPLAMWPKVREVLEYILHNALTQKEHAVPLSNVKRIFRSQFKVELSETSLGYSKLSELLRDAFVSDLCTVELQRTGYVMIPRQEAFSSSINHEHGIAPEDQLTPRMQVTSASEAYHENECDSASDRTASPDNGYYASSETECIGSPISETSSKRRRPLMMEHLDKDTDAEPCPTNASDPCSEPNPVAALTQWQMLSPSQINQSGCIGGMIQHTFIHHPVPPPSPAKGR